jgi:hypothetical protein
LVYLIKCDNDDYGQRPATPYLGTMNNLKMRSGINNALIQPWASRRLEKVRLCQISNGCCCLEK